MPDFTMPGGAAATGSRQLNLFSQAAADSIRSIAPTLRDRIHAWIIQRGTYGATNEEISDALNLRASTVSARTCELKSMGLIEESGERKTSSGRKAAVLVAKHTTSKEVF